MFTLYVLITFSIVLLPFYGAFFIAKHYGATNMEAVFICITILFSLPKLVARHKKILKNKSQKKLNKRYAKLTPKQQRIIDNK
jgi:uncharacterized membrane protein